MVVIGAQVIIKKHPLGIKESQPFWVNKLGECFPISLYKDAEEAAKSHLVLQRRQVVKFIGQEPLKGTIVKIRRAKKRRTPMIEVKTESGLVVVKPKHIQLVIE